MEEGVFAKPQAEQRPPPAQEIQGPCGRLGKMRVEKNQSKKREGKYKQKSGWIMEGEPSRKSLKGGAPL